MDKELRPPFLLLPRDSKTRATSSSERRLSIKKSFFNWSGTRVFIASANDSALGPFNL